ncbi:MAG TPA: beta-N-acetylhexosaminidase [Polyangiaceae bacterium]|nr:beta-N-acetylhexosaminidase [Polyangiaceae bacterium]
MAELDLTVSQLCGQLLVGGFSGTTLPTSYATALAEGRRAGAILFARNIESVDQVVALNAAIIEAAATQAPPLIAVDQEGGRVARLTAPFLDVPPMRRLGERDDLGLTREVAVQMARELSAHGFNLDFAPVMDVDSNPDNPIIGDRSFGRDARTVMTHGVAFIQGLQRENVLACAKHYPGHGDTSLDSHLDLPTVDQPLDRLKRIEIPPFRAASGAGVASMMSAHVVYPALEPAVPATFSRAVCTALLRHEIGFDGVLFSDDLEMGAIAKHHGIARAARESIWAGCDVLLICSDEALQDQAHAALVKACDDDPRFLERCREAATRSLRIRRLVPPRIAPDRDRQAILAGNEGLARRLVELVPEASA